MCDQRERLMDYLYDEAAPTERRLVEAHLDTCDDCRAEIRAFRRVREDLLAWDVPDTPSVWTPFVTTTPAPWYRQVPAWAMTAAAGIMFAVGLAGGMLAHVVTPGGAEPTVIVQTNPAVPPPPTIPVVQRELPPMPVSLREDDVMALVQGEIDRLSRQQVNTRRGETEALVADVAQVQWAKFYDYMRAVANERELERKDYDTRISNLRLELDGLRALLQQQQQFKGNQ
jgi:anti-sigma factor RsiW